MNEHTTMNGAALIDDDAEELAIRDIQRLAAREPGPVTVIEKVDDRLQPFEQQTHTLLMESLDRLAMGWIEQLKQVRATTIALEQQVLESVALSKNHVTALHLLGAQIQKEAQRSEEVCAQLAHGLDHVLEGRQQ